MSKQDKAIAILQKAFDALESTTDSDIDDFDTKKKKPNTHLCNTPAEKSLKQWDFCEANG